MKTDTIITVVFIGALIFLGVSLLINTSKACDVNINYDVTVGSNATGTTPSIAEVKLACYKLCVEQLKHSDYLMNNCLEKCEVLE